MSNPGPRRQAMHNEAAEWLEEMTPEQRESVAEIWTKLAEDFATLAECTRSGDYLRSHALLTEMMPTLFSIVAMGAMAEMEAGLADLADRTEAN